MTALKGGEKGKTGSYKEYLMKIIQLRLETIKKGRLRWAGHASQNSLLRMVLEQNPVGKRPLGRPKLR